MFSTKLIAGAALALATVAGVHAEGGSWSQADRAAAIGVLIRAGELEPNAAPPDDTTLTLLVLRHARVELGLRIRPDAIDRRWAIAPPRRDVGAELAAARANGTLGSWLGQLAPANEEYSALRAAEGRYRTIVAMGGWTPLPKGAPPRAGERSALVADLRARLAMEGYPVSPTAPPVFDGQAESALRLFQRRHRLDEDGRLGPATRAALDTPAEGRLAQIEANLERWRWLPRPMPRDRIEVDVGAAEIRVLQADCETLTMKIVVGDPDRATPMFASRIEAITFNPPWKVPDSIAKAEILPKAAKDPGYLVQNDFVFVDGRLQQKAGPKSALGQVKFELPSPFGVYLHDTPAKGAFERPRRHLSHGCVRLEKPVQLAQLLLARQGWAPDRVTAEIATGRTQTVPLKTPTALYVLYWTATVAIDGQVEFRPDIYGWDRKLTDALAAAEGTAL